MSLLPRNVVLVGLGNAGQDHSRALEKIPGANVIAGIDPDRSRGLTFKDTSPPIYADVPEAARKGLDPDIVVIATPTGSHADVWDEVSKCFQQASILVEKPAAHNLEDALRIVEGVGAKQPVNVAYHMAFSEEVDWALRQVRARSSSIGFPVSIEARYVDPYQSDLKSATERLGTSWLDSGINALSVIERFAELTRRNSLRAIGDNDNPVFEGRFTCETAGKQPSATVLTSWQSSAPTRTTRIRYSSGAELIMDHHAVAGYMLEEGKVSEVFGSNGDVPRRVAHYQALYQSWLCDDEEIFSIKTSLRLHKLLLE